MQDEPTYIEQVAAKARKVCEEKGWKRNWSNGGCYLHLEVSEFIESLRGKGDDSPAEEAADILFVLLAMLHAEGISAQTVLEILDKKCDDLLAFDHDEDRACTCGYKDSEEMTRHAALCRFRQQNTE
jgi:NTP pyrophosphatase (non-canonical NTP hydrolase)